MDEGRTDYKAFRQRLDAVLRQKDPTALRIFLIGEGQWPADATNDAEAAMWMMIAAAPALVDMRSEAIRWLMTHGHEAEAQAIAGRGAKGGPQRQGGQQGNGPRQSGGARRSGRSSPQGRRPRSNPS